MPRLGKHASKKAKRTRVHAEMSKFRKGKLYSSSGQKVTKRSQAIAISLSEAGGSKRSRKKRSYKK